MRRASTPVSFSMSAELPHVAKSTRDLRGGLEKRHSGGEVQRSTFARFSGSLDFRLLQHGVIPGSSQTKARESALQERMRPASCGLATMESGNGVLCRTGRVVEANIDLRGGPVGIGRARGRRRFRSRGDLSLRAVKGAGRGTYRPRDRTDIHVALD